MWADCLTTPAEDDPVEALCGFFKHRLSSPSTGISHAASHTCCPTDTSPDTVWQAGRALVPIEQALPGGQT